MSSTIKAATLKVTITEEIKLKESTKVTNTLSISSINEVSQRIVTVPTSEVTIISFGTAVAAGTYVESNVRYIRITNLDDDNFATLNIEGDSSTDFSVRLDPGASHLIVSSKSTGVVDYADISGATLEDLTAVKATADTAVCDLELFIASA
jgi:hypothetical protein